MIEWKEETDEWTITIGTYIDRQNTPLSEMGKSSRQKIKKDVTEHNTIINGI